MFCKSDLNLIKKKLFGKKINLKNNSHHTTILLTKFKYPGYLQYINMCFYWLTLFYYGI